MRPGRASLALDLLEELRAPLADRFVVTQINLGIFTEKDFQKKENGAVFMTDDARKAFFVCLAKEKTGDAYASLLERKGSMGDGSFFAGHAFVPVSAGGFRCLSAVLMEMR